MMRNAPHRSCESPVGAKENSPALQCWRQPPARSVCLAAAGRCGGSAGATIVLSLFCFLFSIFSATASAQQSTNPWQPVAQALGRAGEEKDGVYRVAFPRTDLRVHIGGVSIRTGLALTSWAAFQKAGDATMMMGDLVLLTAEVSPVVSKLTEFSIEVTAIHNHLLGEQPRVMYMHFHRHGDAVALATALRSALALTGTPLNAPRPRTAPEPAGPDASKLETILGSKGTVHGGVVSFSIPRTEKITYRGATLGPRMGLATAINFQAEGSGAVTTGDFVLVASEVQPVIRALRKHGIEVTALHNHMLDEQPRLFFLHFWGRGDAGKLARGLRAALDGQSYARWLDGP